MTDLVQGDVPSGELFSPSYGGSNPPGHPTGGRRAPIVPPDSALAAAARDLVTAHRAEPGARECARCGQPSPCWTEMHARRVLAAAGEPDRAHPTGAPLP